MDVREFLFETEKAFAHPEYETVEIDAQGPGPGHNGVLRAFAANILRGEPLIADGREGINGLMISNAMHLSSWLKKEISLPIDEDLFLSELNKKIKA